MDPEHSQPADPEPTAVLLGRIRAGDRAARETLFARYLPVLRGWAHRRLPAGARDLRDTDDLVQDTLLKVLARLDGFEHRGEGAFLAYLRQGILNAVRDDVRAAGSRPRRTEADETLRAPGPTALDEVVGRDQLARFERALARLTPEAREAVVLRIEFGYGHQQIAEALGKPTANAARMTVARALVDLAKAMHDG